MPVAKSALAVIRHEQSFATWDLFFEGTTRFVKFTKVWESHRRFRMDFTIESFYVALSTAFRCDGQRIFVFYPQQVFPHTDFEQLWVAAPSGQ